MKTWTPKHSLGVTPPWGEGSPALPFAIPGNAPRPGALRRLIRAAWRRAEDVVEAAVFALLGYERVPEPERRIDRVVLPMSSMVAIPPNTSATITARPQGAAFRPERILIGGTPGDWVVNDVKVGNRSQFSQSGDVPGVLFAHDAQNVQVSFETVQTAMDFVMLVTYVGKQEAGAPFEACVIGSSVAY